VNSYPSWLVPNHPNLIGQSRIINKLGDEKERKQIEPMGYEGRRNRHREWATMFENGTEVVTIAMMFNVSVSTVRRGIEKFGLRANKCQRVRIGRVTYDSKREAMRAFNIGAGKLEFWLEIGKAKLLGEKNK
jgi:hypothetical protein